MMFFIGLFLSFFCGLWWHIGRIEDASPKTKMGVAMLNALGWALMFWALLRWWIL